jgi:hypothetical protein
MNKSNARGLYTYHLNYQIYNILNKLNINIQADIGHK